MVNKLPVNIEEKIKAELDELNKTYMEIDGRRINPAACYHFSIDPPHFLYDTDCPDILKEKIKAIISKYIIENERGAH
jgi:hypothetical protein